MIDLILFPFNGNARDALIVINQINDIKTTYHVLGFIDDNKQLHKTKYHELTVLGGQDILKMHTNASLLAVPSRAENFRNRNQIIQLFNHLNTNFETLVSPSVAIGPGVKIGKNTLIMPHVVLGPDAEIGDHCIIFSNTVIGHNVKVGDYTIIGATTCIAGNVEIEENCYIGIGANIIQDLVIKRGCLIGTGSVITKDTEPNSTIFGNPGRKIWQ
ncbi:MAG: hypothetical protein CMP21_01805 [Rickettsiales bacterium]|nr:hypothetical protein [Rickettsiales bacterium]|tara:strand:- start:76 stop:720 length:645 start_codon:yes stop_codon:yes gene_type:complete